MSMRAYSSREYLGVIGSAAWHGPSFLRRPYASREEIERYQYHRIKALLDYAYGSIAFYRKKYDAAKVHPWDFRSLADLKRFPILTKDELIANAETFLQLPKESYIESVSSGSSGKVVTLYHDPANTWGYALGRYRILDMAGSYRPWDTTLYIYTSEYPAQNVLGLYRSAFIPTLNPIPDTIRQIKQIRPQMLCTYPSHLFEMMKELSRKEARALRLKLISVGSEMSTRAQRNTIAEYFQTTVLDEYSSEELGWMATECTHGSYHVWEDICHLEFTRDHELVGTNLHNFATPCIRYAQNDIAESGSQERCTCGRNFLTIKNIIGRKNDHFTFSHGRVMSPAYLLDSVYAILLQERGSVADFCLIQTARDEVRLEILPGKLFDRSSVQKIKLRLKELFPADVNIDIIVTDKLSKTKSGKQNPIISRVA